MTSTQRSIGSRITTDLEAAAEADIVVEAVFEELDVKRELFADSTRSPGRTRSWRPTPRPSRSPQIAAATRAPEAVVGTHFFSPVPMMQLCELVRGYKTSDETLAAAREFAEGMGKTVHRGQPRHRRVRHHPADHRAGHARRSASSRPAWPRRGRRHRLPARLRPRHGAARDRGPDRRRRHAPGVQRLYNETADPRTTRRSC